MMKVLKSFLAFALFTLFFVTCSKDEFSTTDADKFATLATTELQERSGTDFGGCFELVFPIEIHFADGTIAGVDSAKGIRDAIKTWKQANPDMRVKPSFVFPISVVKSEGEILVIENPSELRDLRKECPRKFGPHHGKGQHCFKLNFPFTMSTAAGEVVVISSLDDIKRLRDQKGKPKFQKPELVFPVGITLKDGEVKEVASKGEFKAIKEACKN